MIGGGSLCRGFAFATLAIHKAQELSKCLNSLNKTKWKGQTLKVEVASPDFIDKFENENFLLVILYSFLKASRGMGR